MRLRLDPRALRRRTAQLTALAVALVAALACGGASAFAQAPYEPNDSPASAFGPLAPGSYAAAIETPNDRDLFRFYVAEREQQVIVDVGNTAPAEQFNSTLAVGIYDARLEMRDYECVLSPGESAQLGATLGPGVYYVGVEKGCLPGDPGATYSFTITGALADAATMQARCAAAGVRVRAAQRAVKRARRGVRSARRRGGTTAVKRARARLKRAQRGLNRARRVSRQYCVTG